MTKIEKLIDSYAGNAESFNSLTLVITVGAAESIVKNTVQQILEQIEDCKFSQLGELIEKLKKEYK